LVAECHKALVAIGATVAGLADSSEGNIGVQSLDDAIVDHKASGTCLGADFLSIFAVSLTEIIDD